MISRMAMDDIAQLRADGIDVPPREVVRLNALGLKVERGAWAAELFAAPRVAFLGACVLREPTLGAEMWYCQALETFNGEDDLTAFSLRYLSCAVPWRELPDQTAARAVRKAIKAAYKRIGDFTIRQVENAIDWCVLGNLPESGEKPPPRPSGGRDADKEADELPERFSPEFGLFHRGMAVRIGTAADMKDLTVSAMLAVCDRSEELATASAFGGWRDRKAEKGKAFGDYMRALDAVRVAGHLRNEQTNEPISKTADQATQYSNTERQPQPADSSPSDGEASSGSLPSSSSRGGPQTKSIGDMAEDV